MSGDFQDISDKEILAETNQTGCGDSGLVLSMILPSGRTVTSECFRREDGAKALIAWCDVIRDQRHADAQAERDEVIRLRMEQVAIAKRQAAESATAIVGLDGSALSAGPERSKQMSIHHQLSSSSSVDSVPATPEAFAQMGLARASQTLKDADANLQYAMLAYSEAQSNVDKWTRINQTFGDVSGSSNKAESGSNRGTDSSAGAATPRRRGRPRKDRSTGAGGGGSANSGSSDPVSGSD